MNETNTSNAIRGNPSNHSPILALKINPRITCPAHMLANSRKHKVIGRTEMDTNSITQSKGPSDKGDPKGKKDEKPNGLKNRYVILATQKNNLKNKLKEKIVLMV